MKTNYGLSLAALESEYISFEEMMVARQDTGRMDPLRDLVGDMRSDLLYNRLANPAIEKKYAAEMSEVMRDLFGINITLVCPERYNNMGIIVPNFGKESTLYSSLRNQSQVYDGDEAWKAYQKQNYAALSQDPGVIDFNAARVSGGFSKMGAFLLIDVLAFFPRLKTDELVAIILHEIGHLFEFFSTAHRTRRVMTVLNNIGIAQFRAPKAERINVLKLKLLEASRTGELPEDEVQDFLDYTGNDSYALMTRLTSLAVAATIDPDQKIPTSSKFRKLHEVSNEQTADAFVSRLGYGGALATGLTKSSVDSKLSVVYRPSDTAQQSVNSMIELGHITSLMIFGSGIIAIGLSLPLIIGSVVGSLVLELGRHIANTVLHAKSRDSIDMRYDTPLTRMVKILENEIDMLRLLHNDKNAPKNAVKAKLKEIAIVQSVIEGRSEKSSIYSIMAEFFHKGSRTIAEDLKLRNSMEALARNKLYVESIKILYS
jgi:hypothetical protein